MSKASGRWLTLSSWHSNLTQLFTPLWLCHWTV